MQLLWPPQHHHHRVPALNVDQDVQLLLSTLCTEQQQRRVSLPQLSGSSSQSEQQHAVADNFTAAVETKPYI